MAPHRRDNGKEGAATAQTAVRHAQVAAVGHEGERAQVKVQDHEEGVGDGHGLLGRRRPGRLGWVGGVGGVVVGLAPPQVPPPGLLIAAHQALVTGCTQENITGLEFICALLLGKICLSSMSLQ